MTNTNSPYYFWPVGDWRLLGCETRGEAIDHFSGSHLLSVPILISNPFAAVDAYKDICLNDLVGTY